jgi:VanZ family protein
LLSPGSWAPIAAWAALIFTLSTGIGTEANTHSALFHLIGWFWPGIYRLPIPTQDNLDFCVRKCAHLTVYAVFGILARRAFDRAGIPDGRASGMAWALAVLYAASDEYHQTFVPGRTPKVTDVGIDAVGCMIGLALYQLRVRRRDPIAEIGERS